MSESGVTNYTEVNSDNNMRAFSSYELRMTSIIACQFDQRFSYRLYVPPQYLDADPKSFSLLIAVHGTDRRPDIMLEEFSALADEKNLIVLAPIFPAGIGAQSDFDSYKYIKSHGVRFDEVLLAMVAEVAERYRLRSAPFSLFGFSGGAHFVHRFLLLHAAHVNCAVVAAPGSVTCIDDQQSWWVGTSDIEERFGITLDMSALREISVCLVVGEADLDPKEITHKPGRRYWMEGANSAGVNRVERLKSLERNLDSVGVDTTLITLPDVAHEIAPLIIATAKFLKAHV